MRFARLTPETRERIRRFFQLYTQRRARVLSVVEESELFVLASLIREGHLKVPPVYISASELALCLNVSYYRVKKWIEQGALTARRTPSGRYHLNSNCIDAQLLSLGYKLF